MSERQAIATLLYTMKARARRLREAGLEVEARDVDEARNRIKRRAALTFARERRRRPRRTPDSENANPAHPTDDNGPARRALHPVKHSETLTRTP